MNLDNCFLSKDWLSTDKLKEPPHSGYHWDGSSRRFFEGWYYRVTLPQWGQSFAFMYSIDDPMGGKPHSGGAAQILGENEHYLYRLFPNINTFWASEQQLALCHWQQEKLNLKPQILEPTIFKETVKEGYQATNKLNQGYIEDPVSKNYCRWCYKIKPIDGWGSSFLSATSNGGMVIFFTYF